MSKALIYISVFILLNSSCQNEHERELSDKLIPEIIENISGPEVLNKDTLIFEKLADNNLSQDSSGLLFVGDCFILDSFPRYGFICYEILGKHTCAMAPVKLDSTQTDLEAFKNGTIRMVGMQKNKYIEGLHIWSKEEKEEFILTFRKVGKLNLAHERPAVSSYGNILEYDVKNLEQFIWMQDNTYSEENKIYPKVYRLLE